MKAVIMAGGKGTRLKPLTCHLPKPMVPLLNRPCMEYIIDLLKKHGITEIAVTLQYLPQAVINHFGDGSDFGVKLHYFEEITPLGTAGSVKNAQSFLDETFLVISGDGLTDIDLDYVIDFHTQKQAQATLVLTRVEDPLEYGVVMTDTEGKISRFLEKPSWGEVFSDTVNTGIYVLDPTVLDNFALGEPFDFSKDLFPLLLNKRAPLYGCTVPGYWSDIGSLAQYRQTQIDMMNQLVKVDIQGELAGERIWLGCNVKLDHKAQVTGPVFIGEGSVVEAKVKLGPNSIIGRYNRLESGAEIENSVVWNRTVVGKSTRLRGAVLCNDVRVGQGVCIEQDTVVGETCRIGDKAILQPGVKIWPGKLISAGAIQPMSVIWGKAVKRSLFGVNGISGIPNLEINPELVGRIATAYCASVSPNAQVSVSCDNYPYSNILKYALIAGLLAGGTKVTDIGNAVMPVARYQCRLARCHGGVHVRQYECDDQIHVSIQFFDRDGLPIDKGKERKIENAFVMGDFPRPDISTVSLPEQVMGNTNLYINDIMAHLNLERIRRRKFAIVLQSENYLATSVMLALLEKLECQVIQVLNQGAPLSSVVVNNSADLGVELDRSGQVLRLWTETGVKLSEQEILLLQTVAAFRDKGPVAIPVTAPSVLEEITRLAGIQAVRTKTLSRNLLEVGKRNPLQVHYDGFYCLAMVLAYLAQGGMSLGQVLYKLPPIHMSSDMVACPVEAKARVMRRLLEDMQGQRIELIDGIKVMTEDAWALILPDAEQAAFKVVAQGSSNHKAAKLAELYKSKITLFQQR